MQPRPVIFKSPSTAQIQFKSSWIERESFHCVLDHDMHPALDSSSFCIKALPIPFKFPSKNIFLFYEKIFWNILIFFMLWNYSMWSLWAVYDAAGKC